MPESTRPDTTDTGTLRPNVKPILKPGTQFEPMQLQPKQRKITLPDNVSPGVPIELFRMYYNPEMIEKIVTNTNLYRSSFIGPLQRCSRAAEWYPTTTGEVYIYLAIRIYSTLFPEKQIAQLWETKEATPNHYIIDQMARNRFEVLHIHFRLYAPGTATPYDKVVKSSPFIGSANRSRSNLSTPILSQPIVRYGSQGSN